MTLAASATSQRSCSAAENTITKKRNKLKIYGGTAVTLNVLTSNNTSKRIRSAGLRF